MGTKWASTHGSDRNTSNNYHAFKQWNTILVTEPVRRLKTRLGAGFQS